jgi:TolA-binding protein
LRVTTEPTHDDSFDLDLRIKRVSNPFSIYGDPDSTAADSEDWMVAFVTEMLRKEAFLAKYPGAETSSWGQAGQGDSTGWFDGDMVRVAEYWRRYEDKSTILQLSNGAILDAEMYIAQRELFDMAGLQVTGTRDTRTFRVIQRIISGAEVLSEEKWAGKYIPIVPVFGDEVNVEGKRYFRSLIRDAKDPQRNFNYWRTTATELLALAPKAPWIGPKGFTKDNEGKWASANTENHAYLEYTGQVPPQRVPFDGPPAGALQESLNASDDMKSIMGIYDASLGARSNETSGVAITARQREGDVSTFHFIDNLSRAIRHTGKILIDMIPRVYNGPRIVRILGEDGTPSNVPINQQVPMPDGKVGVFDLTAGKYDLVVESGPSFSTRRQEAAQQMIEFMRVQPQAGALIGDLLAKNLDWPGAEEIAQRLRAMLPPQLQGQDPQVQQMQQQLQQLQQQSQQAQQQSQQIIQALQMEIARLKGDMTVKQQEANTKAFAAETDRFEATAAAMTPQQIQLLVMQTVQQLLGSPDILPGAAPQAAPPQPPLQSPAMPVAAPPSMQQMSGPSPGQGPGQLFSGGPQAFR